MKINIKEFLSVKHVIPVAIALTVGVLIGFVLNLPIGEELEKIGLTLAILFVIIFLCLVGLAFYGLHLLQQQAHWEHDNYQLQLKSDLELQRNEQLGEQSRKRQEMDSIQGILSKSIAIPPADSANRTEILALVQRAVDLGANPDQPLTARLAELQVIVAQIQELKR